MANQFHSTDLNDIVIKIAKLPKVNTNRDRLVVITQGSDPILTVTSSGNKLKCRNNNVNLIKFCIFTVYKYTEGNIKEFKVPPVPLDDIKDSNGCGDSLVGGNNHHCCCFYMH